MNNKKRPVVRSVDVGYGNTKYTLKSLEDGLDDMCGIFPSLTPPSPANNYSGVLGAGRDTVQVPLDGEIYEVGKDVRLVLTGQSYDRTLDEDFCLSNRYKALVLGALAYTGEVEIDGLVLGLPLTTYEAKRSQLEAAFTGTHKIGPKTVEIHAVSVVPQPLGGFYDYSVTNGMTGALQHERNLVIDPGYFTLDWVVSEGTQPIDPRCNAVNDSGVSAILSAVRQAIERDIDADPGDISGIDEALRTGRSLKRYGKEVKIDRYKPLVKQLADGAVNKLISGAGGIGDIENVMLVGGATHLYYESVREKFPNLEIHVGEEPVFANVRGFQMLGERWLNPRSK